MPAEHDRFWRGVFEGEALGGGAQVIEAADGFGRDQRRTSQMIRLHDRDQLIQVLTNLVQNAFDAVKGAPGGAVTVTTDTKGGYASFVVEDNGRGISPDIESRLFEPYATNKASGTGLGLAIAQRIASEHGGELSYMGTGSRGKGATFRLLIPISGPHEASATTPPSSR